MKTSVISQLPAMQDADGHVSLAVIRMNQQPLYPQLLCTVRYRPQDVVIIHPESGAHHRQWEIVQVKAEATVDMEALVFDPGMFKGEAPPEGLAIIVHGAELVIDSICNDVTEAEPVRIGDILDGVQWLANIVLDYIIR